MLKQQRVFNSVLRTLFVAVLGSVLCAPLQAQAAGSQPQPFTPALRHQVDALVRQAMTTQHLAGVSLAIAKDGVVIYARGYGYRDLVRRLPATSTTIYNIGSVSKQFTAAAVLLLMQDGKLSLEDPIGRFIPGLPWGNQVRLINLMQHTSGVPDYLSLVDNNALTIPKAIAALRKTRLRFVPGSQYEYSNSNYVLLGPVVAAASGMPFDKFVRRRIFTPVGMTSTSAGTTPLQLPNGAVGTTVVKGKTKPVNPIADSVVILDFPDGFVNTTALDLVKWDTALDGGKVLAPATVRLMFTPSHHRSDWPYGYGLGVGVDRVNGHHEIVHEGEWTGYAAENATFPEDGFDIVMLSNTDRFQEDKLKRAIFRLFYP